MILILAAPEDRTLGLSLVLKFEEAGLTAALFDGTVKSMLPNANEQPQALILVISSATVTLFDRFRNDVAKAKTGKRPIFPLLSGMTREEFDTKQSPWNQVVGTAATMQIAMENLGEVITKMVTAMRAIGIKPNATLDTARITAYRSMIMESGIDRTTDAAPPVPLPERPKRSILPLLFTGAVVLALAAAWFFLVRPEHSDSGATVLRIHGSNTIGAKLVPALVEQFIRSRGWTFVGWKEGEHHQERYAVFTHPDSSAPMMIEVFAHGSSYAFKDLGNNLCDIGMSSREVKNDETIVLQTRGLGNMRAQSNEHVLALDGLGIIVHPSNTVRSLTVDQIGRIFSGEISNWQPITGENLSITLYARDTNSGTHETFQHLVMKRIKEDHLSGDTRYYEDSDELAKAVEGDQAAIGFIGFAYAKDAKLLAIGESTVDPLFANFLTIGREDYPLTRRLYLYTSATPKNGLVREFVRFATSSEGQQIVHNNTFVDLNIRVENNPVIPASAPTEYLEFTKGAKRIAVNFRFQNGKDALDTKAQADLERVVDYIKENGYPRLKLIGFTDAEGSRDALEQTSFEKAEELAGEFRSRGINILQDDVKGFGGEVPITTSKNPEARGKNRRVEAWIQ